jgi:hypothetical protein
LPKLSANRDPAQAAGGAAAGFRRDDPIGLEKSIVKHMLQSLHQRS